MNFASEAQSAILASLKASGVDPFKYSKSGKRICKSGLWSASAKTLKSEESGDADLALVLYFKAGAFCPFMTQGCYAACLGEHAGRMVMQGCQRAQVNRSLYYLIDRDAFMVDLALQASLKIRSRAKKIGRKPRVTIRLNGTSDLQGLRTMRSVIVGMLNTYEIDADIVFYEYSKNWSLIKSTEADRGYHLTLSRSETTTDDQVRTAVANGINVAVVFDTKRGQPLPTTYLGLPVIDGDRSDDRTSDPKGVIVGLRAKGRMRKDATGMVVKA
jgi:hypothetical protein